MINRAFALSLAVATSLSLAACGGGSDKPAAQGTTPAATSTTPTAQGTAPADPAAAKAEITATWEKFFHTGTKASDAKDLLEDGANLGPALKIAAQEDKASGLKRNAKVKLITFVSPTTANVTWALLNGTTPVLDNASGQAVYVDGKWLVSKVTFCTLVELGANGKPVPGCTA